MQNEWYRTPQVRPNVELDAFVVMPNHIHGIIVIVENATDGGNRGDTDDETDGGNRRGELHQGHDLRPQFAPTSDSTRDANRKSARYGSPSQTLGAIMRGFKGAATKRINTHRETPGAAVWQRSFYDRVIRSERELGNARRYVADNPARWHWDRLNPPS